MFQNVFYIQSRNLLVFNIEGRILGLHSHCSLNALFLEENEQTNKQPKKAKPNQTKPNKQKGEKTLTKTNEEGN